jgi:hypothetical protein
MNVARWCAILVLMSSVIACVPAAKRAETTEKETNKVTKLIISKREEGRAVPIGTLVFDASNKATLIVDKAGPDGEALKKNWEELSKKDQLTWKRAVVHTIDGKNVTALDGTDVKRSDHDYRWAVQDNLERKYDYSVDSKEN